jgi:hypothetical protein
MILAQKAILAVCDYWLCVVMSILSSCSLKFVAERFDARKLDLQIFMIKKWYFFTIADI